MQLRPSAVAAALLLGTLGCAGEPDMAARPIDEVLREHTPGLMAIPGVVGTAEGARDDGTPLILVFVEQRSSEIEARVPDTIEGHPVEIHASGAFGARTGGDD